ncbi:LOW QUALITY PROTEIN: kinesin-like protein KIF19 [Rhynchonycteris naso]
MGTPSTTLPETTKLPCMVSAARPAILEHQGDLSPQTQPVTRIQVWAVTRDAACPSSTQPLPDLQVRWCPEMAVGKLNTVSGGARLPHTDAHRQVSVAWRAGSQKLHPGQLAGCTWSHPSASPTPAQGSPAVKEMEPRSQQLMAALRIRPLKDTELEDGAAVIPHKVGDQTVVLMDPSEDPEDPLCAHRSREKTFICDTISDQHASQEDVYHVMTWHLVEGVISGYNATVFVYGPSGAGKTYTMLGMDTEPGIYPQTLTDLFRVIEATWDNVDYSVSMSYLEIYSKVIRDLLSPSSGFLDLKEDARGGIQTLAGIMEVSTSNAQEIMQLLTTGNWQRTQEPTATNQASSRSHAVLQVTVRLCACAAAAADLAEEVRVGRLFLVDLAGAERESPTQNRSKRMQEGAHINRSLLALGNCIAALSEKGSGRTQYVNFRDSKLTRLLKHALGGNSQTVTIAHISPASTSSEVSRTTLLYAYRAKSIKTRVKHNLMKVSYHIDQYTDVISNLRGQIERLKSKVERREEQKRRFRAMIPAPDTEEDRRLQMNRIRAQLVGTFKEQLEMRRSLVELENTSIELHIDTWEREKAHRAQDRAPKRDDQQVAADADRDVGKPAEPHEVTLAREEVSQRAAGRAAQKPWPSRTSSRGLRDSGKGPDSTQPLRQAELEERLASAQRKASQLQELLPAQAINEDQREVLRRLCRAHELEVEHTGLQAGRLRQESLLFQKDLVIQPHQQHRQLCQRIIQDQRQLIQGEARALFRPFPAAPQPLATLIRFLSLCVCLFRKCHINEITRPVTLGL